MQKPQSQPVGPHKKDNDAPEHFFKVYGNWRHELTGPDEAGHTVIKEVRAGRNIVTTNGKEFLASFLNSAAATASTFVMKYVGIGTGVGAESAADTTLGTESARTTGTVSYVSGAIYQVTATFGAGTGTGAITEYGLFSAAANGTMLCRDLESVINKSASDTLTSTLQLTLS